MYDTDVVRIFHFGHAKTNCNRFERMDLLTVLVDKININGLDPSSFSANCIFSLFPIVFTVH